MHRGREVNSKGAVQTGGGASLFQIPRKFGLHTFTGEVGVLRKEGTNFYGWKISFVSVCSKSKS